MPDLLEPRFRPLLEAIAFAARAHKGQLRKDGQTPYASHVFRVTLILRHVFGIEDTNVLVAAVLHDTIEDTTTDFDDLAEQFSSEVAGWVSLLSKDKRLPEAKREKAYCKALASAPWQVQMCKLADIFDNLMDAKQMPVEKQAKTFANARRYLDALEAGILSSKRCWNMVAQLLAEVEAGYKKAMAATKKIAEQRTGKVE